MDKIEPFTDEEIKIIMKASPKSNYKCKYYIWKQHRTNGLYIGFAIDQMPHMGRRTAMDNSIDVICTRPITDKEYLETIQNWGKHNRKYICWHYNNINFLMEEDLMYGVTTPQKFIDECNRRKLNGSYQSKITF